MQSSGKDWFVINSLFDWCDDDPENQRCLDYFANKTKEARLPCRADINPVEMKDMLSTIALFDLLYDENEALNDIHIALHGTLLDSYYGPMTGKLVSKHAPNEIHARVIKTCQACLNHRAPSVVTAKEFSKEKDHITVKALYIPMSEDNVTIDRIFVYCQLDYASEAQRQEMSNPFIP